MHRMIPIVLVLMLLALAACTGAQGLVGPTGPEGPRGSQGETGPQGPQGSVGLMGPPGPQGEQGVAGIQGALGETGAQGERGPQGLQGDVGAVGARGAIGPEGERGSAASSGPQGEHGVQGPPGPPGSGVDTAALLRETRESVVCVAVTTTEFFYECSTGFYVDRSGTVLTAAHVMEDLEGQIVEISVVPADGGRGQEYEVARRKGLYGLLLQPAGGRQVVSTPLPIAESYALGEPIAVVGYPGNALLTPAFTVTTGTLASAVQEAPTSWIFLVDARAYSGNSGGPVLNSEGEAIGFIEGIGLVDANGFADPFSYVVDITGQQFP